jgi:hypothetical protein
LRLSDTSSEDSRNPDAFFVIFEERETPEKAIGMEALRYEYIGNKHHASLRKK